MTAADPAADRIAAMEAAPDAPESLRERVALAIWNTTMRDQMTSRDWRACLDDSDRAFYREQADAVLAVVTVVTIPADGGAE